MKTVTSKQAASAHKTVQCDHYTYAQLMAGMSNTELINAITRAAHYQLGQTHSCHLELPLDCQILVCDEDGRLDDNPDPIEYPRVVDLEVQHLLAHIEAHLAMGVTKVVIEGQFYQATTIDSFCPTGDWWSFTIINCGGVNAKKQAAEHAAEHAAKVLEDLESTQSRAKEMAIYQTLRRQFHDEYKTVRYMLTPLCNALEVSNTCDDPRTEENPENRALACGRYQLHPSNTLTNSPSDIAPQDAIDLYLAEQGIYGLLLEAIAKIVEETWDVDIRTVEANWGGMGNRSEDVRAAVFEAKYGLQWR